MSDHGKHLSQHILKPGLVSDNTLHVIGVISNPARYHSRYRLAREWREAMEKTANVKCYVVETAFGDRQHEIVEPIENHLALRTRSEIWIKENMINLAVRTLLPRDWRYVAWIDADVFFRDENWALETIHQLQHYQVVQPWQNCVDLGFQGNVLQTHSSFGYLTQKGERIQRNSHEPYPYGHSGFAWACTRAFWEQVQGLMDFCILGSADHHMAFAMIGDVDSTIHSKMSPGFFKMCREWQNRAVRITNKEVGFVNGRIEHSFHGSKKRRYYRERWQILIDNNFDPEIDLIHDQQGLIQVVNKPKLEQAIRRYNRSRCEDSIENE